MSTFDLPIKNVWEKSLDHTDLQSEKLAIGMYDSKNIDELNWPETKEGQFAKQYLTPFIQHGTQHYIDNVQAEMRVLSVGHLILPLVIVPNNYENSYVCSPYGYISLGLERLDLFKYDWLRKIVGKSIRVLQKLLRKGKINQVIYVNNWLLATDLYPQDLSLKHVSSITAYLKEQFPEHAIVFRSLNAKTTPQLKKDLKKCGFKFILNRQVFLTNTSDQALFKTRIIKSDLKLWREKDYEVIESDQLTENDENRILDLYKMLSIDHHSSLNPRLNANFIKLMIKQKLFHLKALKKNGSIDGVAGFVKQDNLFLCPFFGYDKDLPDQTRLYRSLSTLLLLEAAKDSKIFHQSAGASFYKSIRRATGHLEYQGAYTRHLPMKQRLTWWMLKTILNTTAKAAIKNY